MSNVVFAEGERVTLRPIEEADLGFLARGVNHPEVRPFVGQTFPTSVARERRYLEELDERTDAVSVLAVAGDERVGVVEFDPIDREAGVADFALWIHPDHHGGGYGREAAELMIAYAFDELRVHKVTAEAYGPNAASRALLESLGLTREGVGREDVFLDGEYRDTHYFGLLEREWRDGGDRRGREEDGPNGA
jgi:RimJ/RimL family protein N-acetyltransferase